MADTARQHLHNAAALAASDADQDHTGKAAIENPAYKPPGRLGNPSMELKDDTRINSKLLAAISPMGMASHSVPPGLEKLRGDSTLEEIAEFAGNFESLIMQLYENIPLDVPGDEHKVAIEQIEQTIRGGDGQEMKVYIYRPANKEGEDLPAVIYIHGGGMTIVPTFNRIHERWCRSLAANGVVVIMPDFRNAWTKERWNHFPAGLNDCAATVRWAYANKDDLKIKSVVTHGESGGGNLACAVPLKANREGWINEIDGVYALCPATSNLYGVGYERMLSEFPSMIENHGYFLNLSVLTFMSFFYAPNDKDCVNPLAWPYHATVRDMAGLPSHVLVMDELDPLRDEGSAYARRLVKAGVPTRSSVNLGTLHGTSLLFRQAMPEHHRGIAREVAAFAKEL